MKTRVLVCDLANADAAEFDRVAKELSRLKISVLVNNAGCVASASLLRLPAANF